MQVLETGSAESGALGAADTDLGMVMEAWAGLPQEVKARIVKMVQDYLRRKA